MDLRPPFFPEIDQTSRCLFEHSHQAVEDRLLESGARYKARRAARRKLRDEFDEDTGQRLWIPAADQRSSQSAGDQERTELRRRTLRSSIFWRKASQSLANGFPIATGGGVSDGDTSDPANGMQLPRHLWGRDDCKGRRGPSLIGDGSSAPSTPTAMRPWSRPRPRPWLAGGASWSQESREDAGEGPTSPFARRAEQWLSEGPTPGCLTAPEPSGREGAGFVRGGPRGESARHKDARRPLRAQNSPPRQRKCLDALACWPRGVLTEAPRRLRAY